jgi:hypothetical protein
VPGATLITLGLIGLTYGLIESPADGWASSPVLTALAAGAALLGAFAWREHRAAAPMLPLSLFSSAQLTATNVVTFVVYGAIGGALFLLPIQLQQVSGYTALEAGISLLPVTAITLAQCAVADETVREESGPIPGGQWPSKSLKLSASPALTALPNSWRE